MQERSFFHLRIPKAAGQSFRSDALLHLPEGSSLTSEEGCFADAIHHGQPLLALVREPRAHVLSMYMHCKTSRDHEHAARALMPASFEEWLQSWVRLRSEGSTSGFCCYNPVDSQSFRFECAAGSNSMRRQCRPNLEVDGELALKNMQLAGFVGLTEFYKESICLLHVQANNELPESCQCAGEGAASPPLKLHAYSHGVQPHSIMNVSETALQLIDSLTIWDQRLYKEAKTQFMAAIHDVEETYKTKILCNDRPRSDSSLLQVPARLSDDEVPASSTCDKWFC
jgi:hypothetical protein